MNPLDQIPCCLLVTDRAGLILAVNAELLGVIGGDAEKWIHKPMQAISPLATRIFLQTHVWPMLIQTGGVRELSMHINNDKGVRIPVLVNSQRGEFDGQECYHWVYFVALERSRFEAELVHARGDAEATAAALERSQLEPKAQT